MTDQRWERWLHETHSPEELREWAGRLRWFRFCRAFGGHAGDGDRLLVALRAESEAELLALFATLGIAAIPQPPDDNTSRIPHLPHLRQPGHVRVAGEPAFAWAGPGRLELQLFDPDSPWDVTARTVRSAARIEPLVAVLRESVIEPPLDDKHCVCPKYHPALWP
jgi:hypothetical protein